MTEQIPPSPPLIKGGESQNPEPETQDPLSESLAWLDYCLGETILAMEVVKGVTLEAIRQGEPVPPEQFAAMCAAAGLITLRGRASRGFMPSCPVRGGVQTETPAPLDN
jgi:hypothetical protein